MGATQISIGHPNSHCTQHSGIGCCNPSCDGGCCKPSCGRDQVVAVGTELLRRAQDVEAINGTDTKDVDVGMLAMQAYKQWKIDQSMYQRGQVSRRGVPCTNRQLWPMHRAYDHT